ncbi:hypothetical protein CEN49_10650 [Fischerella thermalis CCMEE 5273]|jgi:hypothetical protein|nr:hypothetical protein CEN49_10650 [Fischerella thermalis CCMEE 5273]
MKPIAISLHPDEALKVAIGEIRIILTTEVETKRKILIHACSYATIEDENIGYREIAQLGFSPEEIPTNAIIGWAKIAEIKTYNAATFAIDGQLHGHGFDLNQFINDEGWQGETVYGYVLEEHHYLNLPIMGIGSEYQHGDFWEAQSPFEIVCFERALNTGSVNIAETVGY